MYYKASALVIVSSLLMSACATSRRPVPARIDAPVLSALEQAERGNWRIRVYADTMYEGRVLFLSPDKVRIHRNEIALINIARVDRSYDAKPGGKLDGAATGAGIGLMLSYLGYRFAKGMNESPDCNCTWQIFLPITALSSAIGMMVGAGLDPSTSDWATIWQR
jgi:hypothetical protein